jgi:hypothetical protein
VHPGHLFFLLYKGIWCRSITDEHDILKNIRYIHVAWKGYQMLNTLPCKTSWREPMVANSHSNPTSQQDFHVLALMPVRPATQKHTNIFFSCFPFWYYHLVMRNMNRKGKKLNVLWALTCFKNSSLGSFSDASSFLTAACLPSSKVAWYTRP